MKHFSQTSAVFRHIRKTEIRVAKVTRSAAESYYGRACKSRNQLFESSSRLLARCREKLFPSKYLDFFDSSNLRRSIDFSKHRRAEARQSIFCDFETLARTRIPGCSRGVWCSALRNQSDFRRTPGSRSTPRLSPAVFIDDYRSLLGALLITKTDDSNGIPFRAIFR